MFTKKKKKSLSTILGTFTQTITDLDTLRKENIAESKAKSIAINKLTVEVKTLEGETKEAEVIAFNIKKLLNGKSVTK